MLAGIHVTSTAGMTARVMSRTPMDAATLEVATQATNNPQQPSAAQTMTLHNDEKMCLLKHTIPSTE
jgi:hypothetical protein